MKISVGIPYYESDPGKREVLQRCVKSMAGKHDELIVLSGKQPSLSNAINQLLEMMSGQYLIICNDDVILTKGKLDDLCNPNAIMSPMVNGNQHIKLFHAHMWCMPRWAYNRVGPQFEGYDGFYYDDSDYWMKIIGEGIEIKMSDKVNIDHPSPGRTLGTYGDNGERMANNRNLFISRWGLDAVKMVE